MRYGRIYSRYRARSQSGAVLVEVAILLPIITTIFLAVIEFALAFSEYRTVVTQVQNAARYLSTQAPGAGHFDAQCLVRYGALASAGGCSGDPVLSGLLTATVTVEDASNNTSLRAVSAQYGVNEMRVNVLRVSVTQYRYQPIFGAFLTGLLTNQDGIAFDTITAVRRQVL